MEEMAVAAIVQVKWSDQFSVFSVRVSRKQWTGSKARKYAIFSFVEILAQLDRSAARLDLFRE